METEIKKLSQGTIKLYERSLKKLTDLNIDYKNADNMQNCIDDISNIKFNDKKIGTSCQKVYLSAILWYYKSNNVENDNTGIISKYIKDIIKKNTEKYDKNELNEKEIGVFVEWDKIEDVCEKLRENREKSASQFKKYITIALYVYFPPRRLEDYSEMIVLNSQKDIIDDNNNYYLMNPPTFIFNKYKTKEKYGTQKFSVPNKLNIMLSEYVEKYKLMNKKLLGNNKKDLSDKIKRIFFASIQKNISVNTMRHSYISYQQEKGLLKSTENKKTLAKQMGHSHYIQQDIYVKNK
jgi:hypothetical protein